MKKGSFKKFFSSLLIITVILSTFLSPAAAFATDSPTKKTTVDEQTLQMKKIIAQQESLLEQTPTLDQSLQNLKGDEEVSVIVQLSEPPVALVKGKSEVEGKSFSASQAKAVEKKVVSQQVAFEKSLSTKKVKYSKGFTYNKVFNGMSLTVKASELEALLSVEGVVSVELDEERYALETPSKDGKVDALMTDSTPHLGVPELWDLGYEGEGVKVAVLDTGIDYYHPDFADVYRGGYNFIPHSGNDYARDRADDDGYETSPLDRPDHRPEFNANGSSFYTSHGTHVAGTIVHLAPKIDLYSYRVLGAYGSGATAGIIAAIEKSVEEDMDIINLSLGGSSNSETAPDAIAINNATLAGVTAVIATGNSGPGRGTIGNPASSAFAISVGNSTVPEMHLSSSVTVEAGEYSKTDTLPMFGWTYQEDPRDTLTGTYDLVAIPGVGNPSDFEGIDVEGKVALISRGEIAFVDKIAAAKDAGAVATIIHNNVAGAGPANIYLSTDYGFIPTFDMATADGQALREALGSELGQVTFGDYAETMTEGDDVNSSSSRGPTNPNFDIKPDVVAPGTNIMAAIPAYEKDYPGADYEYAYGRKTGTSMATPHVAGVAALLKQVNPEWTPFDMKVAISNTAKQLNVSQYDVFAQGPGRIQPVAAAFPEALAYAYDETEFEGEVHENVKGTVTFGKVEPNAQSAQTVTKQVVVKNMGESTSDFNVTVQTTKSGTGDMSAANVEVDVTSFTLSDEQVLNVTLNVPAGAGALGNELLGYIHIQSATSKLLLPFAVEFSGEVPNGLGYYFLESDVISPNGDGVLDTTRLAFQLLNNHGTNYIELWDAQNPEGGYYGDGYVGYFHAGESLGAGSYTLTINGVYRDWADGAQKMAEDGVYTVDFTGANPVAGVTFDWAPLIIKTSNAEVEFGDLGEYQSGEEFEVLGTVVDSFVDYKSTVENVLGLDYDVNDQLTVEYVLLDADGEELDNASVELDQEGNFVLSLPSLPVGENELTLSVEDVAGNSSEHVLDLTVEAPNSPHYDDAVWYESVNNFFNAVYFAGLALLDGDSRAESLLETVSVELLNEANTQLAEGDFTTAEYSYQLLVETEGVPQAVKEEAASKIAVKSEEFAIALWYESLGNYYNAVHFAGQAIEAGDARVEALMANVAEALLAEANELLANGNFTEAEFAYQLLVETTGVPQDVKEEAESKLAVKSAYLGDALWYEEVGNLYNAVHFTGLAYSEGDARADGVMARVAPALLAKADDDLANNKYLEAYNAYFLLLATDGVPQHIKDAAEERVSN